MKTLILLCAFLTLAQPSLYRYKIKDVDGNVFSLSRYRGKKLMIVNTASKCGFTPQYAELQQLADKYKDNLVVIGFPANNFNEQEPGSNLEIKTFCKKNYGVTFPLSEKISVRGSDIDPLFRYLTTEANAKYKGDIKWNFEKFLIDENGKLIARFPSSVRPLDSRILQNLRN